MMKFLFATILFYFTSSLIGQVNNITIQGEYSLVTEKRLDHDIELVGDTIITHLLELDTLGKAVISIDTNNIGWSDIPITKMKGVWHLQEQTLIIKFDSLSISYEDIYLPKKEYPYEEIKEGMVMKFKVLSSNDHLKVMVYKGGIYAIIPSLESLGWMKFRRIK